MVTLNWVTNGGRPSDWLYLNNLDLEHEAATFAVYVIWHGAWNTQTAARTVRVGQGLVKSRLTAHLGDPAIRYYERFGPLLVTWAGVTVAQADGVENYLANRLNPLVGERFPNVLPIAVNLPW